MSLNTPNNNPENQKDTSVNLISKAQTSFVEEKLESSLSFFDWKNSDDIFSSFKSFLNKKQSFKQIWLIVSGYNSDQKEALFEQITEEKNKILFTRKANLSNLEKIYKKEYKELNFSKLNDKISGISILELVKLIKSEQKRRKFLLDEGFFDNEDKLFETKKLDEKNLLENIWISKSAYKKLNYDVKAHLFDIFNNYKKINFSDLEIILEVLDDEKSKENLLKYFISSISISNLEKVWLLNSKIKDKIISSIKSELWISESEAKDIFKSLDKDSIFIDIDDIESLDFSSLINNKSIQKQILDEYNSEISEAWTDENIQNNLKLDEKWNIHENFIKMVKSSDKISAEIKSQIDLLMKGNYFEIQFWEKKWFYNIKSIDNWNTVSTKSMIFENVTWDHWVKKLWAWYDEIHSYETFFNMLEKISSSDEKNKFSIKFYTKDDFKNSWIKETVESWEEISNYDDLLKWLNLIDPEWKDFWLDEDKTTLLKEDEKKWNFIFLIKKIDKIGKTITIVQWWKLWDIKISFKELYSIIKSSKIKRLKKINTFSEVLNSWLKWFDDLELKNWNIIDKNDKTKTPIKSFISSDKKWLIINEISENWIKYTIWEIEEKEDKKILKKWFSSSNFTQFVEDIKEQWFVPERKFDLENENIQWPKKKWNIFWKFLLWLSILDIKNSWQFLIDSIKKKLERWNRLKSLKFAQKFGWLFWEEMKMTLQSMKESEEKSLIEEIKWNLQTLDSKEMIEQVELILQNKNSETYEIIAALFAVLKYGNIYPKGLSKYAWSFMWYKALGGTEEFKRKKISDAERDWVNFTEEFLVQMWLKKQKWTFRSKLWKDFIKELWSWEADEIETWKNDASNKQKPWLALGNAIWLLEWREYAWAIWAAEATFWKNGSSKDMQAFWFVLAMSWFGKNFSQVLAKKVAWLAYTTPYSSMMFWRNEEWHIKYKSFIKALIKNAPKFKWREEKVLADLEKAYKSDNVVKWLFSFWKEYWDDLVDYINFKDSYVALQSDKIPEFKMFLDESRAIWRDNEFWPKKEDFEIWVYSKNSIAFSGEGNWLSTIVWNATWWFWWDSSINAFNMYIDSLKSIKDWDWTIEQKRREFKEIFEPFERHIVGIHWHYILWADPTKNPIYAAVIKNWLDLIKNQIKPDDYDAQLDRIFNNFMNTNVSSNTTENIKENTKLSINDILNYNFKQEK